MSGLPCNDNEGDGGWGWGLLGAIWSRAPAGLIFKALAGMRFPRVSTFLYLVMGWVAVAILLYAF